VYDPVKDFLIPGWDRKFTYEQAICIMQLEGNAKRNREAANRSLRLLAGRQCTCKRRGDWEDARECEAHK
jgi:hypothetical protein